jgi:hypothetical protein
MRNAISTTPKPFKIVLRTVGTFNFILGLLGASFLVRSVHRFLNINLTDQNIPYWRVTFFAMTSINVAFLLVLLATAVRFIQARLSTINFYSGAVSALFLYGLIIGEIWRMGARTGSATFSEIAMSVATATGIGNSGVALFEYLFLVPYLYPLTTIVLLQVFKHRYRSRCSLIGA